MPENEPKQVITALDAVGKTVTFYRSPDGSGVLTLPYGGRILGLYAPRNSDNFLWTNPCLNSAESARVFFQSEMWHNSGGHRTWLAPELFFFYPDFPDLGKYVQPYQLENTEYQITDMSEDGVTMINQFILTSFRTKKELALKITKSISPAVDPLRNESQEGWSGCDYAGYTLSVTLEIVGDTAGDDRVALWDLLQLPGGGDALIKTNGRPVLRRYFGEVTPENLIIEDRLVRCKMQNAGIMKFGISPASASGRTGYLYQTGTEWNLIVRNFCVEPMGEYIDVPPADMNSPGDAVQVCSVNNELGCFGELEYHVPAIGKEMHRDSCNDVSQVWAYRGNFEHINEIIKILL